MAKLLSKLVGENFTPPPKVDSQIIILDPKKPEVSDEVLNLAKIGFRMPRKKLVANLSTSGIVSRDKAIDILKSLNLSENIRSEELSLKNWQEIADFLV